MPLLAFPWGTVSLYCDHNGRTGARLALLEAALVSDDGDGLMNRKHFLYSLREILNLALEEGIIRHAFYS